MTLSRLPETSPQQRLENEVYGPYKHRLSQPEIASRSPFAISTTQALSAQMLAPPVLGCFFCHRKRKL